MVTSRHSHVKDNEGEKRELRALGKMILMPWGSMKVIPPTPVVTLWSCWLEALVTPGKTLSLDLKIAAICTNRQSSGPGAQQQARTVQRCHCRDWHARGGQCWMEIAFLALVSLGEEQDCKLRVLRTTVLAHLHPTWKCPLHWNPHTVQVTPCLYWNKFL